MARRRLDQLWRSARAVIASDAHGVSQDFALKRNKILALAVLSVGVAVLIALAIGELSGKSAQPAVAAFDVCFAAVLAWGAWRVQRLKIRIFPTEIHFCNVFRTLTVSIEDAKEFRFGDERAFLRRAGFLELFDGGRVRSDAILPGGSDANYYEALALVDDLNTALDRVRSTT